MKRGRVSFVLLLVRRGGKADVICGHENALVAQVGQWAALIIGLHHVSQCGNTLEESNCAKRLSELREEAWRAACIIRMTLRGLCTFATSTAHAKPSQGMKWIRLQSRYSKTHSLSANWKRLTQQNEAGSFATTGELCRVMESCEATNGICERSVPCQGPRSNRLCVEPRPRLFPDGGQVQT